MASFVGIFVWWIFSVLLAVLAYPLSYRLFRWLPDRGLGFSRLVGWLFTGYVAWILGFAYNGVATSVLAFVLLGVLAWRLWKPRRVEQGSFLAQNANLLFIYEVTFLTLFLIWSLVRMKHPNIEGQEKFMDFAFFNSILRSPRMPPADPWLAGPNNYINYYYFGYFLNAAFARLTGVSPDITYNLAVSNNFALCGLAMLSLGYNLTRALWPGLLGLLGLQVFGNLHGALQVLADRLGWHSQWRGAFNWWEPTRLIKDVVKGERYLNRWWWSASPDSLAQAGLGADAAKNGLISEFPVFSFLHGDLHPHFTALPLTLLLLALGLNLVKSPEAAPLTLEWTRGRRWSPRTENFTALGLVLGAIFMANTWDLPSAGLTVSLLLLVQLHAAGRLREGWLKHWLLPSLGLLGALLVAALPFIVFFHNPAKGGFRWHGARTGLRDTLLFWGCFLAVLLPYAVLRLRALALGDADESEPASTVISKAAQPKPSERVCASCGAKLRAGKFICGQCGMRQTEPIPEEAMGPPPALAAPAWAAACLQGIVQPALAWRHPLVRLGAPVLGAALLAGFIVWPTVALFAGVVLALALLLVSRGASREALFTAALGLVAALLVLGCEFVYLRDVFEGDPTLRRMNTVFKFYFQAWVLFSAALPFALAWTLRRLLRAPLALRVGYSTALALLGLGALVYPAKAIGFVWADFDNWARFPPTLDGAAWMRRDYPADYAAVQRIRESIAGQPVIAEAVGGAYSHYARVSAYTGLRALVGWGNHESQWRQEWPTRQERDCDELFTTQDLVRARQILDQYGVEYVFVGQLERQKYGASGGLDKFAQLGRPVVSEQGSVLYRINR